MLQNKLYWIRYHLHRLSIDWKACTRNFKRVMTTKELKETFQILHLIQTSSSILTGNANVLMEALQEKDKLNI